MTERKKPGRKVDPRTLELVALVQSNLHLERLEIMELIWKKYPTYSEDQFRMLIWQHGLPVKKSPRRKGPRPLPPGRQRQTKPAAVRGSIVGYHGRSRMLGGYYEL